MKSKGEYYSKWLMTLEKNREILHREFSSLSGEQVNYHFHIHNCSIAEILDNLANMQRKVIQQIDRHMNDPERKQFHEEYHPGYISRFVLRLSPAVNCKPGKTGKISCINDLIRELTEQNMKLEDLIRRSAGFNLNKRIFRYGLLRLSMGDEFEFITKCQQKHVVLARRMMMLQNLI